MLEPVPTPAVNITSHNVSAMNKTTHIEARNEPLTIDSFVRQRASLNASEQPVISYPKSGIEYVHYSMHQLDVFAFRAAQNLATRIPPRTSSSETPSVIGFLGFSNLNYLVTLLALAKLGHTGLLLSTRISIEAYLSLLETTGSLHIIIHPSFRDTAEELKKHLPALRVTETPAQDIFNYPIEDEIDTKLTPHLDPIQESKHIAWIIHSSGSTGLPKPIYHTHVAALKNYAGSMNMSGFITLPLYHNHGISVLFRTIFSCKTLYLYNAELPLTKQYLLDIMKSHDFEIFYGVPYALKLLAESQEGISVLAGLKAVMFGGSACPDSLGDRLVASGVHLISHYGSYVMRQSEMRANADISRTETGQLMTSMRPREDKGWDWLRPSETVLKYLRFEERSPGIYELLCLDGWPSKVTSNRPDGSYATKDLFIKHPTMEAYKYYARLDDTIVLVNGEKVNPLDMEGRVRQHDAVSEAIVFGVGKARIGLVVIRSVAAADKSDGEVLDGIWPVVEKAHEAMPAFGQLSKSMVKILSADTQYPCTDKGTVIRQAFYREFGSLIEEAYAAEEAVTGSLNLSEKEMKLFLREHLQNMLPLKDASILSDDADFFGLGMDSLQATHLRSILMKNINTNGQQLGLNVAFEHPSIMNLARYLCSLASGLSESTERVEDQMKALIDLYSKFDTHKPSANGLDGKYIVSLDCSFQVTFHTDYTQVLTGATGSLGCHIAAQLSTREEVRKIYCLVRASCTIDAYDRVLKAMRSRRVYDSLPSSARNKLIALPADLSHPTLGLEATAYNVLTSEITDIIHCAWSVNFNLHLSSFVRDSITGLKHLIDLSLRTQRPTPASFNFCSSISAVVHTSDNEIPESLPESLSYAQDMGYAQSKLVGEHICIHAAAQRGLAARVLRIGQVIGDTQHGIWNTTEAIPLMLQSATTIGALPTLNESPLWLPVDVVAGTVIDISLSSTASVSLDTDTGTGLVYNIVSQHPFHWTHDLLPYLRAAGLQFEELDQREWLCHLRSNADPVLNPPIKLVDFFAGKYDTDQPRKSFVWHTDKARLASSTLANAGSLDQGLVDKMVGYFKREGWVSVAK